MTVSAASPAQGMGYRWGQLTLGLIVMMSISSPQYTWALFTGSLLKEYGVALSTLQWAFSLLVIMQTFLSPLQANLVERFGARTLISAGALMSGASWILSAYATNVWMLYLTYGVIGGFGTGIVYVGVIGLMVRWFPDRRGFATGMAAAGYGVGAILTTFPISEMLPGYGYAKTWVIWGVIQGWWDSPQRKACARRGRGISRPAWPSCATSGRPGAATRRRRCCRARSSICSSS